MKMPNTVALRRPPKWNWKGIWKWDSVLVWDSVLAQVPPRRGPPAHHLVTAEPEQCPGGRMGRGCTRDMQTSGVKEQPSTCPVPVCKATAANMFSKNLHSSLKWEKDMVSARNGKSCNMLHQSVFSTPRCEEIHFLGVSANVYWSAFQNVSWFLVLPEAHFFPSSGLFVFAGLFHIGREG